MADKGKGKAVDDTAGTSSPTSGTSFLAAPGGGDGRELPTPTTMLQQPLSNQARGSAPFGGQNQIANPQFAGGGGGGGSGAGYGGFSQFADGHGGFSQLHSRPPAAMLQPTLGSQDCGSAPFGIHAPSGQNQIANPGQTGTEQPFGGGGGGGGGGAGYGGFYQSTPMVQPPVGNPGLGHGGFSQPAATLGYAGSYQSTPMVQPPVGNPAFHAGGPYTPACTICEAPTPLLWNATTVQAVGRAAGSIPEFLAAIGRGGWFSASQWAANPVTSPFLWCVGCNFPAKLLWDNLPMCRPCYGQALDKTASYECAKALAQIRAEKALAQQQVDAALAQGRRIVIGPQRQLDHGQSSSAAPPHAQAQRCHRCGAPEPTRMSQGGFPVCELCFNN
ncbi:zinc finger protein 503 [Triticum aestivum]|uniref:zinc finger protein 503 n=1 Tax=Triticum aestivum TaxID=4565 RepID=UPI001D02ACB4|nr:zinc finger protein 503-like [Triticum aestivum]